MTCDQESALIYEKGGYSFPICNDCKELVKTAFVMPCVSCLERFGTSSHEISSSSTTLKIGTKRIPVCSNCKDWVIKQQGINYEILKHIVENNILPGKIFVAFSMVVWKIDNYTARVSFEDDTVIYLVQWHELPTFQKKVEFHIGDPESLRFDFGAFFVDFRKTYKISKGMLVLFNIDPCNVGVEYSVGKLIEKHFSATFGSGWKIKSLLDGRIKRVANPRIWSILPSKGNIDTAKGGHLIKMVCPPAKRR